MCEVPAEANCPDYDERPERFRAAQQATSRYGLVGDVHERVAERIHAEGLAPVLDLGCGEGRLIRPLRERRIRVVGLDGSATMPASVPEPKALADARDIPFPDDHFGSVAALYVLYHLPDPAVAMAESRRVLRAGGLFVACAPSRHNDPELSALLPTSPQATFDAENGPDMVSRFFQEIEVERWDGPLVLLPDRDALLLYLKGRGLSDEDVRRVVTCVSTPLTLTKRGALIFGYKRV